jgi:hypothetical protein
MKNLLVQKMHIIMCINYFKKSIYNNKGSTYDLQFDRFFNVDENNMVRVMGHLPKEIYFMKKYFRKIKCNDNDTVFIINHNITEFIS